MIGRVAGKHWMLQGTAFAGMRMPLEPLLCKTKLRSAESGPDADQDAWRMPGDACREAAPNLKERTGE
jgi:hypothetical protein